MNLAYLAARGGTPTLLCDLDPQGAASFYFRIKASKKLSARKLLKGGPKIWESLRGTDYDNLDLLPSNLSYRNLDIVLDARKKSRKRLKLVIAPLAKEYEYLFLDCPPNITLLSENVFHSADIVLVPMIPTTLSILTLEKLERFFEKNSLPLGKLRPFFSMVEVRKRMHKSAIEALESSANRLLGSRIPYLSEVEKMGIHRAPLACFSPSSRASKAFVELWKEVEQLLQTGGLK